MIGVGGPTASAKTTVSLVLCALLNALAGQDMFDHGNQCFMLFVTLCSDVLGWRWTAITAATAS